MRNHSRALRSGQPTSSAKATTVGQRRMMGAKKGFMMRNASFSVGLRQQDFCHIFELEGWG